MPARPRRAGAGGGDVGPVLERLLGDGLRLTPGRRGQRRLLERGALQGLPDEKGQLGLGALVLDPGAGEVVGGARRLRAEAEEVGLGGVALADPLLHRRDDAGEILGLGFERRHEVAPAPRLEVAADGVEHDVLLGPEPPGDGLVALPPGLRLAPAPREEVEGLGDHGEDVEVGARDEVVGPGPPVLQPQVEGRVGEAAGGLRGLLRPLGLRASGGGERRVGPGEGHGLGQGQRVLRRGLGPGLRRGPDRQERGVRRRGRGGRLQRRRRSHGVIAHLERDAGSTSHPRGACRESKGSGLCHCVDRLCQGDPSWHGSGLGMTGASAWSAASSRETPAGGGSDSRSFTRLAASLSADDVVRMADRGAIPEPTRQRLGAPGPILGHRAEGSVGRVVEDRLVRVDEGVAQPRPEGPAGGRLELGLPLPALALVRLAGFHRLQ